MFEFKSKCYIPTHTAEPDFYIKDFDKNLERSYPDENFVISRTKTGIVLSRYRDDYWDLSPYTEHSRGPRIIYFNKIINDITDSKIIIDEYKWIMFMFIFITETGRSSFLSVSTIYEHSLAISSIAQYCLSRKITFHLLFRDKIELKKLINSQATLARRARFLAIIRSISNVDKKISGFDIADTATLLFNTKIKRCRSKQTVIIPSRIFSCIISSCNDFLNQFILVKDQFLDLVKKSHNHPAFARSKYYQKRKLQIIDYYEDDFQTACYKMGISNYVSNNRISNLHDVSRHLRKVQYTCKLLIHIYTGMRDNEVSSLKYDCLRTEISAERRVFRIVGETTKLIGLRKAERWVTSREIEPAINVLKQISKIIAECMRIQDDNHILFLPVSNLAFSPGNRNIRKVYQSGFSDLRDSIFSITIEESDIKELQKISPNADWLSEPDYQIGAVWPTASHQFRRTLAVYAAQSGLVSIPSLKRQLKHISREMTLYYAAGSSFSKERFDSDKTHFIHDYNESKSYGEGLGYIYNLLLSEQQLHGPYGNWLEKNDRKGGSTQILEKREETIKRFKRGELAYSETPLGACMSSVACDKKAMRAVSACISCDKAVIIESKLEKVIFSQQLLVNELDNTSMEYRMEQEQLRDLQHLQARIRKNK